MTEIALSLPFDSNEIKDIVCAELRKRLDTLGPLQGAKEYNRFEVAYEVAVKVYRVGETGAGKETLAWGKVEKGEKSPDSVEEVDVVTDSKFVSQDPNEERLSRDMPLTVETKDGLGNTTRKKVRVKG
jgi:hypothetical protein